MSTMSAMGSTVGVSQSVNPARQTVQWATAAGVGRSAGVGASRELAPSKPLGGQADSASRSRWLMTALTPSPRMETP